MTDDRTVEQLLDRWLVTGPSELPDRVFDEVESRIWRTPQRSAWRLFSWRFPAVSTPVRIAVLAAALLVIALAAAVLLSGSRPVAPQPTPGPSPSGAASAGAFSCSKQSTGCAGPLAAGQHATTQFTHPFRFAVPDGWVNDFDVARTYSLKAAAQANGHAGIEVLAMLAIADQQSNRCDPVAKAGVGTSVEAIVGYVSSHPGLVSTAPVAVTVNGYQGKQIDFSVALTWGQSCPGFNPGDPVVLLLTDTASPPQRALGYGSDVRVRWTVIDVNGDTVIIECAAPTSTFDADVRAEQSIIDSIDFHPTS